MATTLHHLYSVIAWLNRSGAPGPRTRRKGRPWCYSTVSVMLRNPALVGMFAINARAGYDADGMPEVRRGADGEPVVASDGIISFEQYKGLLHAITYKAHSSAPHRRGSSPLLALLVTCSGCQRRMWRTPNRGKPCLWCRICGQLVKTEPLATLVVRRLLTERGSQRMYRRVLDVPDDPGAAHRLADIDHAIRMAALALTEDRTEADEHGLNEEIARLKRARLTARQKVGTAAVERYMYLGTVKQVWNLCIDDQQRHEILAGQIETLELTKPRASSGGYFTANRVHLTWSNNPKPLVPDAISVGPIQRRMRQPGPWISRRDAYRLAGSSESLIRRGVESGEIARRTVNRMYPSLNRASVMAYLHDHSAS